MVKFDITGKATIGYLLMTAIIVLAGWLVYGNTQSVMLVDKAEKQFMQRRDLTDSLVYSVLDVNNKERAICLGLSDRLPEFNTAVERTLAIADTLKHSLGADSDTMRIDSLKYLVQMKRQNTFQLMKTMGNADADKFYREKVKSLSQGQDSVMMKQKAVEIKEDKETVYEVVKTKKTFFARLADAFRKQRSDTVHVARHTKKNVSDSLSHNIDISDTIADVLNYIRQQQAMNKQRTSNSIKRSEQQQQMVGMELTQRISQIMADIRSDEHNALQQSLDKDMAARQSLLFKIILLALAAATTAAVLSIYIKRSIRREREYRRSIEEAKDETERIMKQREQLLLTITHDIKAPAASISGFIELLKDVRLDPQTSLFIENIGASAKHLLTLVGALLDYHRLDAGKVEPHPVPFRLMPFVAECVAAMKPQADEKGLEIRLVSCDDRNRIFKGDTFRIKQIIDNLMSNAIKYTDQGCVSVKVDMGAITVDGRQWTIISVADTGRGMTKEECDKVFKAFTRLADAQGTEGVGLGLSITKELIEMLGGKIKLESCKGKGSCFTVSLPLEIENASDEEYKEVKDKEGEGLEEPSGGCRRILIVDDDKLQLKLLVEMLKRIDRQKLLSIRMTTHPNEAIEAIATFKPDIMFVDIEMPEMSGMEVIRKIGKQPQIKFFAMTAHEPTIKDKLINEGFDGCLFKPFSMESLAKALSVKTANEVEREMAPDKFHELTAFAEGDKEAEREIFCGYISELEEFIKLLTDDGEKDLRDTVAHVAHKSLPLMKMIGSGICDMLIMLQPDRIRKLSDGELSDCIKRMTDEFRMVAGEMRERC